MVVVSKPDGISVHGGAGEPGPTLIDLLAGAGLTPFLVHRLDRATSGAVVVAKRAEVAKGLSARWEEVEKRYLALVLGRYRGPARIDLPLEDRARGTQPASTLLSVLSHCEALEPTSTLLEVILGTGRTHQIRRHLQSAGHPILLDDKHGDFKANKAFKRALRELDAQCPKNGLMLHATRIVLPWLGLDVRAPLRPRFASALAAAGADLAALP